MTTVARPTSDVPGVTRHALDRLLDHYGVTATRDEWMQAVLSICDRTAALVRRSTDPANGAVHNEVYIVAVGSLAVQVAWSPRHGSITTVLPPAARHRAVRVERAAPLRDGGRSGAIERAEALLSRLHQQDGDE
jgi:hypothetical protein